VAGDEVWMAVVAAAEVAGRTVGVGAEVASLPQAASKLASISVTRPGPASIANRDLFFGCLLNSKLKLLSALSLYR